MSTTVTDAEGTAVANGTKARFDVRVLGTATLIVAETTEGIASSIVTPLAGISQGVAVIATAGNVQASVLVVGEGAAPPAAPPLPPSSPSRPVAA